MPQNRRLLIVVADGEHARFLHQTRDQPLRSESAIDSASAHKRSADLGSDEPGSTAHHGLAPRHDLHEQEKDRFARMIAREVNAASAADTFDALVLVAPPHVLNVVRDALDAKTAPKLLGTLYKDLAKTPDHQLQPHLAEWVPVAHRPGM